MKESRDDQASGRFDWLGALLVALAVGGLSFGAIYGQQRQWQDPLAFVALGVGVLATIALPLYFARARNPLVPLGLFRSRNFTVTNISTLLIYGALYVLIFFQVLFLQGTWATAPRQRTRRDPGPLFLVFLSTRFGALGVGADRAGSRPSGPVHRPPGVALAGAHPGRLGALALRAGRSLHLAAADCLLD